MTRSPVEGKLVASAARQFRHKGEPEQRTPAPGRRTAPDPWIRRRVTDPPEQGAVRPRYICAVIVDEARPRDEVAVWPSFSQAALVVSAFPERVVALIHYLSFGFRSSNAETPTHNRRHSRRSRRDSCRRPNSWSASARRRSQCPAASPCVVTTAQLQS